MHGIDKYCRGSILQWLVCLWLLQMAQKILCHLANRAYQRTQWTDNESVVFMRGAENCDPSVTGERGNFYYNYCYYYFYYYFYANYSSINFESIFNQLWMHSCVLFKNDHCCHSVKIYSNLVGGAGVQHTLYFVGLVEFVIVTPRAVTLVPTPLQFFLGGGMTSPQKKITILCCCFFIFYAIHCGINNMVLF